MIDDYQSTVEQLDQPWFYKLVWIGGTVLLVLSAWLWWAKVSVQPERVFWGTISNNLVIGGVTREATSKDEQGSLTQTQQVTLGAQNLVRTVAAVEQKQDNTTTKVLTETIATPSEDFSRYVSIETSTKVDFAGVLNQWSKQPVDPEVSGGFSEALFGDLVPFANLPANKRNPIVNDMKNNKVYDVDYSKVEKRREGGRLIYDYSVTVSPEQYIKALKQIDDAVGLKQLTQLNEADYAGGTGIPLKISIDAHAQQLIAIAYEGDSRQVSFKGYGAAPKVDLPQTNLTQAELQTKLNGILKTQ